MNNLKINRSFLAAYIELEKTCAKKLDNPHGVTEYINKLTDMRFASGRGELLPRLIKYRKIRNRIVHEPGAMKNIDELSKEDISWLKRFNKEVYKGRDAVSEYLKKASSHARRKAFARVAALAGAAFAVVAVIAVTVILF